MKAVELARTAGRHPTFSASQSGGQPSNARAIQAANVRGFQTNQHGAGASVNNPDGPRQHDPQSVYECFISAVIGSISYNLSRFHQMIPLNYRTFVPYPKVTNFAENSDDDEDDFTMLGGLSYLLTTLDAHLSTAGTLVISTSVSSSTNVYQLEAILSLYDAHDDFLGELVRIAPCGIIARYVGHETSAVGSERDGSGPTKRSRAIQQWKTDTLRWLRRKGLVLPDMDEEGKWVRIQLQPNPQVPKDLNDPSSSLCRECLWPSMLCFFYNPGRGNGDHNALEIHHAAGHHDDQDPGTIWWQGSGRKGFADPLWQAYNWFLGKPEREKAIEARKKARQAQEENTQPAAESTMAYPSSPLYSRGSAYGDLQAVSGVYPTPPDAVLPPNASGHTNMDGIILGQTNQDLHSQPGHLGAHSDALAFTEHNGPAETAPEEHLDPMRDAETPVDGDNAEADNNDDLFEDMDEEMFGGNDVTEADFNFFDDGEGPGFGDLMDVSHPPVYEEPKQDTSPPEVNFEAISPVIQMRPLEQAEGEAATVKSETAGTPDVPAADVQMSEIEDFPQVEEPPFEQLADVDATKLEAEEQVPSPRKPSPPLSPARIKERLFPSPHVGDPVAEVKDIAKPKAEGGAMFDTVDFSKKMQSADSKYAAGGQFYFSGKDFKEASDGRRNLSVRMPPGVLSRPTSSTQSMILEKTSDLIRSIVIPKRTDDDSVMDDGFSDDSDSYSDICVSTGSLNEETGSAILQQDSGLLVPTHKKQGSSNIGTPMVGTPGTLQLDSAHQDAAMSESDSFMVSGLHHLTHWPRMQSFRLAACSLSARSTSSPWLA